jgi:hypothetical protein
MLLEHIPHVLVTVIIMCYLLNFAAWRCMCLMLLTCHHLNKLCHTGRSISKIFGSCIIMYIKLFLQSHMFAVSPVRSKLFVCDQWIFLCHGKFELWSLALAGWRWIHWVTCCIAPFGEHGYHVTFLVSVQHLILLPSGPPVLIYFWY